MMYFLITERLDPLITFFVGVILFLVTGIISVDEAVSGFSNKGVLTLAVIYMLISALRNSGALSFIADKIFSKKISDKKQLLRIIFPTTLISSFVNNIPVVAAFSSMFMRWSRKHNIQVSKFLIPISFASIFGGICTLIGTSTNLVVSGLLEQFGYKSLGMFDLTPIGIPLAVMGIVYLYFIGYKFIPLRKNIHEQFISDYNNYLLEMEVTSNCELIGKTVKEANLRNLKGVFLVGLSRDDNIISPISPEEIIVPDDKLIFTGKIDIIDDLKKIKGLKIIKEAHELMEEMKKDNASFFEAVISLNSQLIGKTAKDLGFREKYKAAILAIHRKGKRVISKIGNIKFKPGDVLFLIADKEFKERWYRGDDFFHISRADSKLNIKKGNSIFISIIFLLLLIVAAFNIMHVLFWALLALSLIILTKNLSLKEAKESINLEILVFIALALGIGKAIINSGTANFIAGGVYNLIGNMPEFWIYVFVYLLVVILTEMITNNSAAIITLPIAIKVALLSGIEVHTIALLVAIAASSSFLTPIGYQTNLIVYGLGNYKFTDFFKVGLPLTIIFMFGTAGILTLFF